MQDYYNEISGIDIGQMSSVVAQVWDLLALAEGVNSLNTSGLTNCRTSMKKMGDAGVSGFADAFRNCGDTINESSEQYAVYGQRFHHGECFYSQFCYGNSGRCYGRNRGSRQSEL